MAAPPAGAEPRRPAGAAAASRGQARDARPTTGTQPAAQVWATVRKMQESCRRSLGAAGRAAAVASSLQLALENEKLKDARDAYIKALQPAGEKDADVVGYVVAINGKISTANIYPSNALFRKMWPKLLEAVVTEAIGEKNAGAAEPRRRRATPRRPSWPKPRRASRARGRLPPACGWKTRDADKSLYFETRGADGRLGAPQLSGEVTDSPTAGHAPAVGRTFCGRLARTRCRGLC